APSVSVQSTYSPASLTLIESCGAPGSAGPDRAAVSFSAYTSAGIIDIASIRLKNRLAILFIPSFSFRS
ncbi:MAG: hypothetical protein IKK28_04855, partial [Mogibacterium sp.]|nr:hypothetical protein [Mogibacterium sp.]